nr:hypothetical protein [Chlamydiota bacterium]
MSVTYREVIMQMATPIYQENPNIRDLEFSTLFHRIGSRNPRVAKWPEKVTIKEADPKVLEIARRSLGGRMGSTEARNQSSLSDHLKNRDFEKALEAIVHLPYKQKDAARVELAQLAVDAHKDTLAKDLLAQSVDASLLKSQLLVQLGVVNGDPKTHYYN